MLLVCFFLCFKLKSTYCKKKHVYTNVYVCARKFFFFFFLHQGNDDLRGNSNNSCLFGFKAGGIGERIVYRWSYEFSGDIWSSLAGVSVWVQDAVKENVLLLFFSDNELMCLQDSISTNTVPTLLWKYGVTSISQFGITWSQFEGDHVWICDYDITTGHLLLVTLNPVQGGPVSEPLDINLLLNTSEPLNVVSRGITATGCSVDNCDHIAVLVLFCVELDNSGDVFLLVVNSREHTLVQLFQWMSHESAKCTGQISLAKNSISEEGVVIVPLSDLQSVVHIKLANSLNIHYKSKIYTNNNDAIIVVIFHKKEKFKL
ncbi:hypothetical protein RFI_28074 [Reticulomyxa filosa]|uniref:Uncharacterized protein n=1 Tax=Reticulomyxa filosa TaxID=46433 RepID=X6M6R6_RETFI|nr:hypothetical protein RFI_28074 [Reticulomyxa filosa]|eukprot:ETO09316.1 hypothetical protein RFI_28074 [Reticulomyxa filosa]